MTQVDLLLRGGNVAPEGRLSGSWVAVHECRILAVGAATDAPPAALRIDDRGDAFILPGIVEGQTHAASYKGLPGIEDTGRSAVAGRVMTLLDMPYHNRQPLDRPERLSAKAACIEQFAHSDMALYATVTSETDTDTDTDNVDALIAGGASAFKISSFESSPTRFLGIGADLMHDLMFALAEPGLLLGLHNEVQEIVLRAMAAARAAGRDGIEAHSAASRATIPAGRYGTPAEFAAAVVFLCAEQAGYFTGSMIRVDGGMIRSL